MSKIQKFRDEVRTLNEEMQDIYSNLKNKGFAGLGISICIIDGGAYETDKKKILKKKRYDNECGKFIKKLRKAIKEYEQ